MKTEELKREANITYGLMESMNVLIGIIYGALNKEVPEYEIEDVLWEARTLMHFISDGMDEALNSVYSIKTNLN